MLSCTKNTQQTSVLNSNSFTALFQTRATRQVMSRLHAFSFSRSILICPAFSIRMQIIEFRPSPVLSATSSVGIVGGVGGLNPPGLFSTPPHVSVFLPWGSSQPSTSETPPVIESSYYYKMAEIKKLKISQQFLNFLARRDRGMLHKLLCIN